MQKLHVLLAATIFATLCNSCLEDPDTPEPPFIQEGDGGSIAGFYVLNEGNWGQNKASLDFYDYSDNMYTTDVYSKANPDVILGLGDVGNDLAVYNGKLFALINGSNKVEVMDAKTAKRITQIDIDNCRNITFDGDYAYVSSFVGGDGDCGSVSRIDLKTLTVTGKVSVGKQPEELVVADGMLYVANSGQFQAPEYDKNISIVRLSDFTLHGNIEVDINMHRLRVDKDGNLWVTSRGNYADIPSNIYKLQKTGNGSFSTPQPLNVPCNAIEIAGDKIYFYGTSYDENWNATYNFGIIDTASGSIMPKSFITDGSESSLSTPYCIAVQPSTGDIFVTDARNYVSSGQIRCYSPEGKLKWTATTGDIPGHIAFIEN